MEWIIEIVKAILTFAGVFVTVYFTLKGKKLEIESERDAKLNEIIKKFDARLDVMGIKLDDIKTEQLKIALVVSQLQKEMGKNNDVVEDLVHRVCNLENQIAVLDNRESVSEHRLTDLENKA